MLTMLGSYKKPELTLGIGEVPLPKLGPNDVLVAVMAAALNYNNVWSSIFEPMPGFSFLGDFARLGKHNRQHNQDYHIIGSDASGIVVKTGEAVNCWKPGDRVVIYAGVADYEEPECYSDSVRSSKSRAWGFETNFGAFADFTVVRQTQLLPKPEHLTWEESASITLTASTCYRMLISENGAQMKQGDIVLIWGASGGLGSFAVQMVLNGGGFPIAVVSSEWKAEMVRRLGCKSIILFDNNKRERSFINENGTIAHRNIQRFKVNIRKLTGGEDPDIVFEHSGRSTFAASVAIAKAGGKIVTCGSTSGYEHIYDNRYLWQSVKSIIGSHGANYDEAMKTIRLANKGSITPILSKVCTFEDAAKAFYQMHKRGHVGKIGILCLAPKEGMGIRNREFRNLLGEDRINVFRDCN